jgi:hypothetical protein
VVYEFPIESWTKEEVLRYCEEVCPEYIPPHYYDGEQTSHDCWDCVAYLDENQQRIKNLPDEKKAVVFAKLANHYRAVSEILYVMEDLDVY